MPRHDRYGDRGPKSDRGDLTATYATQVGSTMRIHRLDGSAVDYRYTVAGWRMIPGSDTKANAKAEVERDLANLRAQPVKVHLTAGCGLCGSTGPHTHEHREWEAFIDRQSTPEPPTPPPPRPRRGPLAWIDRKITEAQTCPGCGCNADQWREGCDCLRQGCSCAGAEQDDTGNWEREPGPDAVIPDAAGAADLPPAAKPFTPPTSTPPEVPDLHDQRRGRWHDEKPITTTNTGSAGGSMANIEEVQAGIAAANEKANEGLGAVQQAHASLEEAQGQLMQATEGSGQGDVSEVNGLLAQAVNSLEEVRQQVSAAIAASEGVANRL